MVFISLEQSKVQVVLKLYRLTNLPDPGTELSASAGNLLNIHAHCAGNRMPGEEVLNPETCIFEDPLMT